MPLSSENLLMQQLGDVLNELRSSTSNARLSEVEKTLAVCVSKHESTSADVKEIKTQLQDIMSLRNRGAGVLAAVAVAWSLVSLALGGVVHNFLETHWKG